MKRFGLLGFSLLLLPALAAWPHPQAPETSPKKVIEKVPIKPTSASSGEEMYKEYCAVCHGLDGKGNGPAASALKTPPPDLSLLAKNNGGKYPASHVVAILNFGSSAPAHGSADMPVWGRLLSSLQTHRSTPAIVQLRIKNLTDYIESLQAK
ncbi:MAG: cytochrome c [Acidobacteriia bacterium]|nr:cytochrome c [Terriglobia bacterium]